MSIVAKFRPLIVPAVNGIITLLTAIDEDVRKESANALSTLSEYGMPTWVKF
jgi:hypothetical protein